LVLKCIFLGSDGVFSVGDCLPLLSHVVVPSCWSGVEADDLVLKCIFLDCDGVRSVGVVVALLSSTMAHCC